MSSPLVPIINICDPSSVNLIALGAVSLAFTENELISVQVVGLRAVVSQYL